jgi:hypothetical protein
MLIFLYLNLVRSTICTKSMWLGGVLPYSSADWYYFVVNSVKWNY